MTPATRAEAGPDEPSLPLPAFAGDWCFFLDLDGTLLDIEATPSQVSIGPDLRDLLANLTRRTAGAVALISGRALADLDRLFAPEVPLAAGQHGAERRTAAGKVLRHHARRRLLREVAAEVARLTRQHRGLVLEDKGACVALHYRQAPHLEALARYVMQAACGMLGGIYEVQEGKMVFELKPSGYDKGSAIEAYMGEAPFAGRVPVFLGDDLTDEFGFGMINALGGHSVKVGGGATRARSRLADARAVRTWLSSWLGHVAGETGT